MSHPVRFLWTVPRSVSTSFERMMMARGDHTVLDEPFSRVYYYGPERRSDRYDEQLPDSTVDEVLDQIWKAAEERPVFVKDMAYHALGVLDADLLSGFENSFLVRHPSATLRSLSRNWPDFTDEEAGWQSLDLAADIVEGLGDPLTVVDADSLCADPERVVGAWCEQVGVPFLSEALTWPSGMRDEWDLWDEWHASTASSTGFEPLDPPPGPPGPDEPRVLEAYQAALPVYERFAARSLGADPQQPEE